MENLCLLLAIVTALDSEIYQMDVDTVFLQAQLEEEVYTTQSEGFLSTKHPQHVCLLKKSLYGLKQAPLAWNRTIDQHLQKNSFRPCQADPCVYVKTNAKELVIITIYVDDCVIIAPLQQLKGVKKLLSEHFKITNLGPAQSILSIKLKRDREKGTLRLSQPGYIKGALSDFNMVNCKPKYTPATTSLELPRLQQTSKEDAQLPYPSSLIGKLLYIALATRPDIAYIISHLARFVTGYSHLHWEAAKHVLQYLQATKDIAIKYSRNATTVIDGKLAVLIGYCGADWAANKEDRKSISAYTFMLAGGPISWALKAQTTVAISSTEAEYIALSEATRQAIYVNALRKDLKLDTTQPLVIYIDN